MRRKKDFLDGYLTVEASFLFPLIFLILMLLIYWGFYCYDKSVSIQCSYLAALRASNHWEMSDGQQEIFAMEQLEKLTEETFLFMKKEEVCVEAGIMEIKAKVTGGMDILLAALRGDDMDDRWTMESEKKAYRLKPASFIRTYRIFGAE